MKAASLVITDAVQSTLNKLPPADSSNQKQPRGTGGGVVLGEKPRLGFYIPSSQGGNSSLCSLQSDSSLCQGGGEEEEREEVA